MTTLALPDKIVSIPISTDSTAVAQAPTGVLMGPEADNNNILTQADMVLMNDSCKISFCTGLSAYLSLNIPLNALTPPIPEPEQLPTSET